MAPSSDTLGAVTGLAPTPLGIELACTRGALRVECLAEGVVRVRVAPSRSFAPDADWDVLRIDDVPAGDVVVTEADDAVVLDAGALVAEVARSTSAVRLATAGGVEVTADAGDGVSWDRTTVRVRKRRHRAERHFGFGERSGGLDQTAGRKTLDNTNARRYGPASDEMYCCVPFFLAHRADVPLSYGFFLDTPAWSRVELDAGGESWTAATAGTELRYVVFAGDDPASVLERFTALAGRIDLPPRWALGYHQSHWGYDSAAALRRVSAELDRHGLPCDVLHLDIDYLDRHRVFTWDPERFADPDGLVAELAAAGRRCVAIIDPGVAAESSNPVYVEGVRRDAFVRLPSGEHVTGFVWPGRCVFPDFLRRDVRQWWGDLHAAVLDAGVAGIWCDMNEPAIYADPVGSTREVTVVPMPGDAVQGPPQRRVRHAEVHNLYGSSMAEAARAALGRFRPEQRSFALSRAGFAGIQRHAAVWTGDNTSSWEHLRDSLPMLCGLGLSGIAFVGADVGGFWDDATPELFARWVQAGVVYPLMRAHSRKGNRPNEPWSFGPEVEDIARRALALRYRLKPYLYTLFHEAAARGAPVLRPLLWEFPADERAVATGDEALLGAALLAAPVVEPGATERLVYLPAGRWYDWWTGAIYEGPAEIDVGAPLDRLPLFGRAGHLVPLAGEDAGAGLTLRVFPGDGAGGLYEDDGETFAYRDGEYLLRRWELTTAGGAVTVRLHPGLGEYLPASRSLTVELPDGRTATVGDIGGAVEVSV